MRDGLLALVAAASLLGSCAHYAPVPLASDLPAALPAASVLLADSAQLERPFLRAQAVDLTRPLTPNALAVLAVLGSPDLKAARAKAGVSAAQSFAARLLPDPTLTLAMIIATPGPIRSTACWRSSALISTRCGHGG